MKILEQFYVPSIKQAKHAVKHIPSFTKARVISVYDGDTITIARKKSIWWSSKIYAYKVRLHGIDCPEIRGSTLEEKHYAVKAKEVLEALVLNKSVKLDIHGYDKYGRILANVKTNNLNISEHLIGLGLGVPYNGKAKQIVDWKLLYNSKNPGSVIETVK